MIVRFWSCACLALLCCCAIFFYTRPAIASCLDDSNCGSLKGRESFPVNLELEHKALSRFFSQQVPLSSVEVESSSEDVLQDLSRRTPAYTALLSALEVMESRFFEIAEGTWPQAIDWTAAVMGTQVSATLSAMTEKLNLQEPGNVPSPVEKRDHENLINRYFTQITSFYFGENAFSLRTQAYDDMLWVVLGWLEAIKFINRHSELHYASPDPTEDHYQRFNHSWYARQFIPQYAHRARLFYDLASRGWDTSLCGGGMIWNPYLAPYKNAITNELFIAASVGMYLHFPGDDNASPFSNIAGQEKNKLPPAKAHDVRYLDNAVEAYKWLKGSGMRNGQGLYVDGFHIRGWRGGKDGSNGTRECDLRDDKVYTYNQGVLLSALRGLWEATGSTKYLQDGHELVRNVIAATGWRDRDTDQMWRWAGLGRNGILEEVCDWSGTCSQNGQAFKGIFFHHLTLFCSPLLGPKDREKKQERNELGDHEGRFLHQKSCDEYAEWIEHNALAATVTRDEDGVFGEWWGRLAGPRQSPHDEEDTTTSRMERPPELGTDYRNTGVPRDEMWRLPQDDVMYRPDDGYMGRDDVRYDWRQESSFPVKPVPSKKDINDRGRGRTVETQSGGLAVLRAFWSLVVSREKQR